MFILTPAAKLLLLIDLYLYYQVGFFDKKILLFSSISQEDNLNLNKKNNTPN